MSLKQLTRLKDTGSQSFSPQHEIIRVLHLVPTMWVGAQVRLHLSGGTGDPTRQAVHGARRGVAGAATAAARHHVGEVSSEGSCVEAVDDRVAARVQVAKDKQHVVHILGGVLDHGRLEPVPDPQQVVRCPTDDEGAHNHNRHLQGLHPGFWYHVCSTASQALLTI